MIRTKAELRKTIQTAELTASLLRQTGFHRLGTEERRRIAGLLESLAEVARRAFDPVARHDWSAVPASEPIDGPEDHPALFDDAPKGAA